MILVKWISSTTYELKGTTVPIMTSTNRKEHIGIVMGYVPYPTGTRVVIAPLGHTRPVEVPLSEIEFVVSPEQGRRKIRHALKDLRKTEAVDHKPS